MEYMYPNLISLTCDTRLMLRYDLVVGQAHFYAFIVRVYS